MPSAMPSPSSLAWTSCRPTVSSVRQYGIADTSISRLFGYDQGVTGGLLDLPSFTKYFPDIIGDANATNQGIAVAAYNLGCFLGAVFTIFVGNPLGRRKTIFYGSIVMTVGALLQCTSYDLPQWIVGRIVTGWGNGMGPKKSTAALICAKRPRHEHVYRPDLAERDSPLASAWETCHDRRHAHHCGNLSLVLDQLRLRMVSRPRSLLAVRSRSDGLSDLY